MAEQTVYCEECVEDIPTDEVYWEDGRIYCRRCGSEVEAPDQDIFEQIVDNRTGFVFRNETLDEALDKEEEEDDEEDDLEGRKRPLKPKGAADEAEPGEVDVVDEVEDEAVEQEEA